MDIKPQKPASSLSNTKIQNLNLTINQQLEVKIIRTKNESQTLILRASQSSNPIHVKTNLPIEARQGQSMQVLVTKLLPALEFEVLTRLNTEQSSTPLDQTKLILKQFSPSSETQKQPDNSKLPSSTNPLVISAKIISVDADKIQLKIPGQQIISINKDQLSQLDSNQGTATLKFKTGQTIQLEASDKLIFKTDFKRIDTSPPKLAVGQYFSAKVTDTKGGTIQLQLSPNNPLSNLSQTKADNLTSIISLNKSQLLSSSLTPAKQNSTPVLKTGQHIQLEVIKTGTSPKFKLINNPQTPATINQQVIDTMKQVLPIQLPPTELVNQLINNLPKINNETTSDNLKRLAREILETLPNLKETKNPKQLKSAISNSGLLLESKLAQSSDETEGDFQADFKNKLLKFQHALKQEIETKTDQKTASSELNTLKEMQQKTESSLARVVLNQLTSLPKEEAAKQVWILDLPFMNKGTAESVKIEINREKPSGHDEKEENWAVTLTITPPELATIHCKISCLDKAINTRFWSDAQDVVTKITHHLDYLDTQLKAAGLETGHLSAHKGINPKNSEQIITHQNLLNQKV